MKTIKHLFLTALLASLSLMNTMKGQSSNGSYDLAINQVNNVSVNATMSDNKKYNGNFINSVFNKFRYDSTKSIMSMNSQRLDALNKNAISLITNGAGTSAPGGNFWGYGFGDYAYVQHGDSAGRGTDIQYKGLGSAANGNHQSAIELRRLYLGYNVNINKKFSAYAVLEYQGDYDVNNNRTVYLKYAYFKWSDIFKNSDLKIGQQPTNSWSTAYNTEALCGYRSIEKTIMDMHKLDFPADMGVMLEGKLWKDRTIDTTHLPAFIGYSVMVGDNSGNTPVPLFTNAGTAANQTSDKCKKYRINLFVNTLNSGLTIGGYYDYINYGNVPYKNSSKIWQDAASTIKGYAVYNQKWFGVGFEYIIQTNKNGETEVFKAGTGTGDTTNAAQSGISIFAHGTIIQKRLNIFGRFDEYLPDAKYAYNANETFTSRLQPGTTWKEIFISGGFDWSPTDDKRVHFMPNIWYYGIANENTSVAGDAKYDFYLIYRLTFLFAF